jgi:hypothetical protein
MEFGTFARTAPILHRIMAAASLYLTFAPFTWCWPGKSFWAENSAAPRIGLQRAFHS